MPTHHQTTKPPTRGAAGGLGLAPNPCQRDGREPRGFEHVGERTHGARADRSNGGEQHHVDAVVGHHLRDQRPGVEPQRGHRVVELRAHERVVPRGH